MEEAVTRIQLAAYLSSMIEASYDPYYQLEPDDEVSNKSNLENIIPHKFHFILPGSEVPNWFGHKKIDSSTSTLKLPSMCDCYCNYLGFALCLVLGPSHLNREEDDCNPCVARCECYFGEELAGWCCIDFSINDAESDLVWLCYEKFSNRRRETGDLELDPVDICFRFSVEPHQSGLVVKQCGIRPLNAPDDIKQSSNEEGKRPYVECEAYKSERNYLISRWYAHHETLGLPSERQGLSGLRDGKSLPLISCAENIAELTLKQSRSSIGVEALVNFVFKDGYYHQHDESVLTAVRYLAQPLLDGCCNLGKIPDNINTLSLINTLTLAGCNVESLPTSIKHLSMLTSLDLSGCKRLRFLPELPPSIYRLDVTNCISLEAASISTVDLSGGFEAYFLLINCLRLNEQELNFIISDAHLKMKRAACIQYLHRHESGIQSSMICVCLPGSKVPADSYNYRTTTENSMTIQLSSPSNLMGFTFCFVSPPYRYKRLPSFASLRCCLQTSNGQKVNFTDNIVKLHFKSGKPIQHHSDHVILWHDPKFCRNIKEEIRTIIGDNHCTACNLELQIEVSMRFYQDSRGTKGVKIKEWGICPLYDSSLYSTSGQLAVMDDETKRARETDELLDKEVRTAPSTKLKTQ